MMTHPGVYCLRSNQTDWDEATLWRTYFTLTDLEAVVPLAEIRTRSTPDLSPQADSRRRASVHHRHRVSTRAGDPTPPARERRDCELDHASPGPGRPTTHHRHLPTCRRRTLHVRKATRAEHLSRRSTMPWASAPLREGPAKASCRRPLTRTCSATRAIQSA